MTASESWLRYQFINGSEFTWFYGPGTDGGVVFGKPQTQPGYDALVLGLPGQMTSELLFLNQPSTFYSVGSGIGIDDRNTINMQNLRLFWGGQGEQNIGGGVNGNADVPLVADVTALGPHQSGWQVGADGTYHLVYFSTLLSQSFGIHLTGKAILAPPTVTGFWPDAGAPGTFVFVVGANFKAGATQVQVNGVPAPLAQGLDKDLLIFILPEGNTMGTITVTTAQGSAGSGSSFGIPPAGLAITGLWPASGGVNTVVFVFGGGYVPGATQVALNGVNAPVAQVIDPSLIIFLVPPGATSGPITLTTPASSVTSSGSFAITP